MHRHTHRLPCCQGIQTHSVRSLPNPSNACRLYNCREAVTQPARRLSDARLATIFPPHRPTSCIHTAHRALLCLSRSRYRRDLRTRFAVGRSRHRVIVLSHVVRASQRHAASQSSPDSVRFLGSKGSSGDAATGNCTNDSDKDVPLNSNIHPWVVSSSCGPNGQIGR